MRTLLLLCFPVFAFSQAFLFPLDPQLQSYLKLTPAQVDQLQRNMEENQQKESQLMEDFRTMLKEKQKMREKGKG